MKSSKSGNDKNRGLSDHMITLHQRLLQALSLGIKYYDDKGRKWQCTDVEIQGLAIRSMSAFLSCISSDLSQHPLVKNSITEMLIALEGILQSGNETVFTMATNVTTKLVDILGNSVLQYQFSKLVRPLSCSLSAHGFPSAVSCAVALNRILSKLMVPWRLDRHKEVWEAVKENNVVGSIIFALQDYTLGIQPLEHFTEMASLLKTILWRWPPSRFPVWSNSKLITGLGTISLKADPSVATSVLQSYSALALCGNGALKVIGIGETLVPMMIRFLGSSQPRHIRMEALILIQHLARSVEGCSKMTSLCCEPIVEGITNAMNGRGLRRSEKVPADQMPLVVEACRTALITRWPGVHHSYFWKVGIAKILLGLLLNNFCKNMSSLEEHIAAARVDLYANSFPVIRPYIWDILGWLATHCEEGFKPKTQTDGNYLIVLIACACSVAVDSIHKGLHFSHKGFTYGCECEPVTRAVLTMVFSPCNYIASQARHFLSEVLMPNGEKYLENLLNNLRLAAIGDDLAVSDSLRVVTNLIGVACYLCLPQYRNLIVNSEVIKTLSSYIRRCLTSDIHVRRTSIASHLKNTYNEITCCWVHTEDWEGGDIVLFYSLQGLSELIRHSDCVCNLQEKSLDSPEAQILVDMLQKICTGSFSPGLRWYSALSLSFFGFYGFSSKLGKRIEKSLNDNELSDLKIILSNGQSLKVHSVILSVSCPSLLPPNKRKTLDMSAEEQDIEQLCKGVRQEVRLSARVDNHALIKLLEFVYTGFMKADDDLGKHLRVLARRCKLQSLSKMLQRKQPKWGTSIPSCDFTPALGPDGLLFSDIILEGKAAEGVPWNCSACLLSTPHMHVHKILLWSSCDYFQALFQSGMQDSHSKTIKVPVCWEALSKLVIWFYSGELPKPTTGCLWDNMDTEQKLHELQAYVELCWLSDFWFLEEVREESLRIVLSCLKSNKDLSLKIIQTAANFTQWKIVEDAAKCIAPLYPKMRDSGDLEVLDEELCDMVRAMYVRYSQECHDRKD
ncbi:BTB/POZ domain-containing protein [Tasmannia lanceolata]|uniref:BTB/POZ domain-containing protein n=1 Tax=Tasmannia lanceolata TaxID=3420 RepID=UPI0040631F52